MENEENRIEPEFPNLIRKRDGELFAPKQRPKRGLGARPLLESEVIGCIIQYLQKIRCNV